MAMTDAMRAEDHCSVPNVRCTDDRQGRQTPFLCHVPDQVGWGTEDWRLLIGIYRSMDAPREGLLWTDSSDYRPPLPPPPPGLDL